MKIDRTVSLGNVLSLVGMIVSLFVFAARLESRIALLEHNVSYLINGQLRPPNSTLVK